MKRHWLWLLPVLLLVSAQAQNAPAGGVRILVYGADTLEQCAEPVKALQAELPSMRFPSGWTIGIVCNQPAWQSILRIANPPATRTAFSNLIRHSTVLNAVIFSGPRSRYRHTLAHELGHATCLCSSEDRAEEFASRHDRLDRTLAKTSTPDEGH